MQPAWLRPRPRLCAGFVAAPRSGFSFAETTVFAWLRRYAGAMCADKSATDTPASALPTVDLPLAGVRVVSIALNLPGPAAVARLQALGAQVVTVIPPSGDPMQLYAQAYFDELHTGQDVRTVDLKSDVGRAEMAGLLADADVLVTSSRASALRRLGMDFASVHAQFPQVCQVDIVGYPGAQADIAGHDLTYQADAGLIDGGNMPRTTVIDLAGAERAVAEAMAALVARGRLGEGVRREVALSDVAVAMSAPLRAGLTGPGQLLGGGLPLYSLYDTADGWVAVAALEPHFAERLLELLDLGDAGDGGLAATAVTHEQIAAALAGRAAAEWAALAAERDIPLIEVARAE